MSTIRDVAAGLVVDVDDELDDVVAVLDDVLDELEVEVEVINLHAVSVWSVASWKYPFSQASQTASAVLDPAVASFSSFLHVLNGVHAAWLSAVE